MQISIINKSWRSLSIVLLILVIFIRCFWNLGDSPLERWDETTNATVVWELIDSGSFPYLTLGGKPFVEKPPLWYYVTAAVVSFIGPQPHAYRLVSAVAGFILTILVLLIAYRWYGYTAAMVATITLLSTQQLFVSNAGGYFSSHNLRSADVDSLFILFLFFSPVCFSLYSPKNRIWIYIGSITTALAFLTKGPLALLPLTVFCVYAWVHHRKKPIKIDHIINSALLFLILIAPWYIFMTTHYGTEFISQHFGYHIVRRIGESLEGHRESLWFYGALLVNKHVFFGAELLILSFILLLRKTKRIMLYETFMPVSITLSVFVIATVSQTKLAWYILPLYPFAALVVGNGVQIFLKEFYRKK